MYVWDLKKIKATKKPQAHRKRDYTRGRVWREKELEERYKLTVVK